jgi:predicted O-methyltransferase YrrM
MVVTPPAGLDRLSEELVATARTLGGYLADREVRFLALLAACPTADGDILEIGAFQGKSTVVLSRAAALDGDGRVVAVDPFVQWRSDGPRTSRADLQANLERCGVAGSVEFHQTYAAELAKTWARRLRLLWIDGDHAYAAAKSDLALFTPFLADGAIVAMHDVLTRTDGPLRVFLEDVLLSEHFGACGLCGSIAWAQFCAGRDTALAHRWRKLDLYRRLSRLVPHVALGVKRKTRLGKLRYKLLRWRVPHADVDPAGWSSAVADRRAK